MTGTEHEELTLTCSVSLNCTEEAERCCIKWYMFKDGRENGTVISKRVFNQTCEQETSVTCDYKPSANMTATFIFFIQTSCGTKKTEFIVNVTGRLHGAGIYYYTPNIVLLTLWSLKICLQSLEINASLQTLLRKVVLIILLLYTCPDNLQEHKKLLFNLLSAHLLLHIMNHFRSQSA